MEEERKPIVIVDAFIGKYLASFGHECMKYKLDRITIHYRDANKANALFFIRMLRKSFCWIEVEGTKKKRKVLNPVCKYKDRDGNCTNPRINFPSKCTDSVRKTCKGYQRKYNTPFEVNEVIVEKIGQGRGL